MKNNTLIAAQFKKFSYVNPGNLAGYPCDMVPWVK